MAISLLALDAWLSTNVKKRTPNVSSGQTRGSVCVGSDLSDRNIYILSEYIYIYDEARNRTHARNGETEETTEVASSPVCVYVNL